MKCSYPNCLCGVVNSCDLCDARFCLSHGSRGRIVQQSETDAENLQEPEKLYCSDCIVDQPDIRMCVRHAKEQEDSKQLWDSLVSAGDEYRRVSRIMRDMKVSEPLAKEILGVLAGMAGERVGLGEVCQQRS